MKVYFMHNGRKHYFMCNGSIVMSIDKARSIVENQFERKGRFCFIEKVEVVR